MINTKEGSIMHTHYQKGAVSLFVVIFAALLITIITVSFVRIMVKDQQQASTSDLSQSAYDSAQAGVEDAKRALLRYQTICATRPASECANERTRINSSTCNTALTGVMGPVGSEVKIQQNVGDAALDQAYTCVKIQLDTPDYLDELEANTSKVIALKSTSPFTKIRLEWYSTKDLTVTTTPYEVNLEPALPLLTQALWSPNRPSLMRAQFMQMGSNFTVGDFETAAGNGTVFLYPIGTTNTANNVMNQMILTDRDVRKVATGSLDPVTCSGNLTVGDYACKVEITVPNPVTPGARTAFLRLNALYNKTNFRVSLLNNTSTVLLDGVQPSVDSTGRANDLFRRVQSRIELNSTFPYPESAVDIVGSFCKDFLVTDNVNNFVNNCPVAVVTIPALIPTTT